MPKLHQIESAYFRIKSGDAYLFPNFYLKLWKIDVILLKTSLYELFTYLQAYIIQFFYYFRTENYHCCLILNLSVGGEEEEVIPAGIPNKMKEERQLELMINWRSLMLQQTLMVFISVKIVNKNVAQLLFISSLIFTNSFLIVVLPHHTFF